jgi:hypothetical protein
MKTRRFLVLLFSAGILSTVPVQSQPVVVTEDIVGEVNWTADKEYLLNTVVYVQDGATLNIEPGTVEAWGRSPKNPIGGWYGLKKGLRGRFGVYVPPLMEKLGLCELEHNAKNNRMRAK